MNRIPVYAVALSVLVACTQDKQTVETTQNQSPSNPGGTIVGVVTSLRTGLPLASVTVTAPSAGGLRSATTDANGAYTLGGLVGGATYEVRFSLANHVAALGVATVPSTAGDYPSNGVAQLDVALAQANATLNGHVYARDGLPAQGVVLMVDLRSRGFDLVTTATTDAAGAYSLGGLPGAPTGLSIPVVAQPWDSNADGLADYDALTRNAVAYPSATSLLDFDLRLAAADLLLLTSNVESGSIAPTSPIHLTFNRQLDMVLTYVTLYDVTAARDVAVTTSVDATSKILTVVPTGGTALAANHAYTVTAHAVATNGEYITGSSSRSFSADVAVALLPPVTGLIVNPTAVDYDTASFNLAWDGSMSASGYQIWVRDTNKNPSWLLAKTVAASFTPSTIVTLPGTFDYYVNGLDAIQTPFAFGVKVDFAVVAVNELGEAPSPSTATPKVRGDTVAPVVDSAIQGGGNADNTGGATAKTITLTLYFSEYMDGSIVPTIALPAGLVTAGGTATFAWNVNRTVGTFNITIPAATNGTGAYNVSGAKDTSGNTMIGKSGNLVTVVQLVTNGGFEAGTLAGWTPSFTSTSTAPVLTSAVAKTGTWSAQVGNATGTTAQAGYSTLYQTVALPTGFASIVASISYRPYTNYPYYGWDTSSCSIRSEDGLTTYMTLFSTYANSTLFTTTTQSLNAYAGQTVRIQCQTYQYGYYVTGMYLDDVSILATP
ncbi:MAG: carboxypeptidase regulatory-like domain-containing protein [Anaeromyxobacteraceae bacterium]